jgi:hypothetical protein
LDGRFAAVGQFIARLDVTRVTAEEGVDSMRARRAEIIA